MNAGLRSAGGVRGTPPRVVLPRSSCSIRQSCAVRTGTLLDVKYPTELCVDHPQNVELFSLNRAFSPITADRRQKARVR